MYRPVVLFILFLILCGCASTNPYTRFYRDYSKKISPDSVATPDDEGDPIVFQSKDPIADEKDMMRKGYTLIGESRFRGSRRTTQNRKNLVESHARQVGAEIAFFYDAYSHTVSGVREQTVPVVTTSTATSYETQSPVSPMSLATGVHPSITNQARGSGTATQSTGITTTHETQKTVYEPYSRDVYSHRASFWVRLTMPFGLGAYLHDLTDDMKQAIQSNHGTFVSIVVNDTPAFEYDLLEGDIIKKINGITIRNSEHAYQIIGDNIGGTIDLSIWRLGSTISKTIQL